MEKRCVCGHRMTRSDWQHCWVCHRCGRKKPLDNTVSNADAIRNMSDYDLARRNVYQVKLNEAEPEQFVTSDGSVFYEHKDAFDHELWWLQQTKYY